MFEPIKAIVRVYRHPFGRGRNVGDEEGVGVGEEGGDFIREVEQVLGVAFVFELKYFVVLGSEQDVKGKKEQILEMLSKFALLLKGEVKT